MKTLVILSVFSLLSLGFVSPKNTKATVTVQGNCSMCQQRIEKAALGVKGVKTAWWDRAADKLTVTYDPAQTNMKAIEEAVAAAGHDTEHVRASDVVYNKLHGCCKYRP